MQAHCVRIPFLLECGIYPLRFADRHRAMQSRFLFKNYPRIEPENQLILPVADKDCGGASNAVCSRTNATIAAAGAVTLFNFNPQGQASTNAGVITNVGVTVTGENNLTASNCSTPAISVCVNGATGYVQ